MSPKPDEKAGRKTAESLAEAIKPAAQAPSHSDTPPPFSLPHDIDVGWEDDATDDVRRNGGSTLSEPIPSGSRSPFTPSFTLIGSGPSHGSRSRADSLSPGSTFGVYLVGECIGQGGMARIYQAEHAGLRRQVALKVLIDGFARDLDGRERFLREARLAAAIKHPNVVNIFDVGLQDDIPYLVMELLEGQDLEKLVESKGALDEGLIIDIMIPVVAGLTAVHDAGIVHRDLKPGNIFLAKGRYNDLEPKLLDFGISKAQGPEALKLTANRGIMGTPLYISPEGLHGGEMTPLSDQYSLGVVMYECATGCTPYKASAFADLSRLIVSGQYTRPNAQKPELSRRLARIIERSMSLYPQERFKDMREMGRELLTLAGQRTRITWGLSFGELHKDGTPMFVGGGADVHGGMGPHDDDGPAQVPPPAQPRKRKRAIATLLLAPLLFVFSLFLAWRVGMVSFHSSSERAAASQTVTSGLTETARPAAAAAPTDTSVHVSLTVPAIPPTPWPGPAQSEPAVAATDLPVAKPAPITRSSDSHPARPDSATTSIRRGSRQAAPAARRTTGTDSEPEWALPAVGSAGQANPQVGANQSPILD